MSLSPEQVAALRQRIADLPPESKSLLRDLVAEKQQKPRGPTRLPRARPKSTEPEFETVRSHNGTWIQRRKR